MTSIEVKPTSLLSQPRAADGRVAGVCAALAERHRVDPLLVRALFIITALSASVGLVAYLVLWLWMPDQHGRRLVEQYFPGIADWSARRVTVLTVVLCLVSMSTIGGIFPFGLAPVLVIGAVALLVRRHHRQRDLHAESAARPLAAPAAPAWTPDTDFGRAVQAWQERMGQIERGEVPSALPAVQPIQVPAPAPRPSTVVARRRPPASWLFGIGTLVVAAIVAHGVRLGNPDSSLVLPLAAGLAVMALALVIGAFTARPRMVIAAGIATTMALAPATVLPSTPQAVNLVWSDQVQIVDQDFKGTAANVDLTSVRLTEPVTLDITAEGSAVNLELPHNVPVVIHYQVRSGLLSINNEVTEEPPTNVAGTSEGTWRNGATTGPVLTINLHLNSSMGNVQ